MGSGLVANAWGSSWGDSWADSWGFTLVDADYIISGLAYSPYTLVGKTYSYGAVYEHILTDENGDPLDDENGEALTDQTITTVNINGPGRSSNHTGTGKASSPVTASGLASNDTISGRT